MRQTNKSEYILLQDYAKKEVVQMPPNLLLKKTVASLFLMLISMQLFVFAQPSKPNTVTILHTSDIHGEAVMNEKEKRIGYSLISGIKSAFPQSILVDTGDYLHGTPLANLSKGENIVDFMNTAGYDVTGLGSCDFSFGFERVLELEEKAKFPILSSNLTIENKPLFKTTMIKEANGIKIGFFSLISPKTSSVIKEEYFQGIHVEDPAISAQKAIKELKKQGAEAIVAITYLGEQEGSTTAEMIAALVPGIDVVIDGQSHHAIENGKAIGKTLLVNAGEYGENVGQIELVFNENKQVISFSTSLISYDLAQSYKKNIALETEISKLNDEVRVLLSEPVANINLPFKRTDEMYMQSNSYGNLIADCIKEVAQSKISIINSGLLTSDITQGPLTKMDILTMFPESISVQTKDVSPKILKDILENGVGSIVINENKEIDLKSSINSKFPQISGFTFSYNPTNAVGNRIISITLDSGKRLDLTDTKTKIPLATTNSMMTGVGGYEVLKIPILKGEFGTLGDGFVGYLNKTTDLKENTTQRILLTDKQPSSMKVIIIVASVLFGLVILFILIGKLMLRFK